MTPEQLVADIDRIVTDLTDLSGTNTAAGADVVGAVQPPIRTGRLASTVDVLADEHGFTLVAGGSVAPYGPIVHARNPFLTRALTDAETAVVQRYVNALLTALN